MLFHKFKNQLRKNGLQNNLWKLWNLWKKNSEAILNLWKAARARFFRCCETFLHFLTKTHKNRVNRIRGSYSLRSVGIADRPSPSAPLPAHPLHDSRSGALTANLHFVPILAHYELRSRGPVSGMLRIPCNASGINRKTSTPPTFKNLISGNRYMSSQRDIRRSWKEMFCKKSARLHYIQIFSA